MPSPSGGRDAVPRAGRHARELCNVQGAGDSRRHEGLQGEAAAVRHARPSPRAVGADTCGRRRLSQGTVRTGQRGSFSAALKSA